MKDPARIASKWKTRLAASGEEIKAGVQAVEEAPGAKAARSQDRMLTAIIEAVQSGRWGRAVSAVSLEEWKKTMLEKALPRIASGAAAGEPGMLAFMREFLPAQDAILRDLDRTHPRGDLEQNIARQAEFTRRIARLKAS